MSHVNRLQRLYDGDANDDGGDEIDVFVLFVVVIVVVFVWSTRFLVLDFSACSFCCSSCWCDEWAELGDDRCLVVLERCMWCV